MIIEALSALLIQAAPQTNVVLENEYVRVMRDSAPCASAGAGCSDRVIVALSPTSIGARRMARGDIAVFSANEKHPHPKGGHFFEVQFMREYPPVLLPDTVIPPTGNVPKFDGDRFRIFEERLGVGEFRPRHSHPQRVVIQLNKTRLKQIVDGQAEPQVRDIEPDRATFNPPVVHTSENVGERPLRGIVIELKPRRRAGPKP